MLYLNLHIGDWMSGTMLCSALERGVYIDLLVAYYSKGRPLMRSECDRIARAYTPDEREAMRYVLEQFFTEDGDQYRNARADKEIAKCKNTSEVNRANARKRWDKERQGGAADSESDRTSEMDATAYASAYPNADANAMLTRNPKPETENSSVGADKPRRTTRKPLDFYGLPEDLVEDWKAVRKEKRAPLTQTAINGVKRKAEKAGMSFEQAVRMITENGWRGFNANWDAVKERAAELPFEDKSPEEVRAYEEQVAQAYGAPATPVDGEDMLGAMKGTFAGEFADDRAA